MTYGRRPGADANSMEVLVDNRSVVLAMRNRLVKTSDAQRLDGLTV
jgi:hypothetical protein